MAYRWPAGTVCKRIAVDVEDRSCPVCERSMHVCDHRSPPRWTFAGATQVVTRLVHCPDASCTSRGRPCSPETAWSSSLPRWGMGWEVLCWRGHRRVARQWSVPQRRAAGKDLPPRTVSADAIEPSIGLYFALLENSSTFL